MKRQTIIVVLLCAGGIIALVVFWMVSLDRAEQRRQAESKSQQTITKTASSGVGAEVTDAPEQTAP